MPMNARYATWPHDHAAAPALPCFSFVSAFLPGTVLDTYTGGVLTVPKPYLPGGHSVTAVGCVQAVCCAVA